MLLSIHSDDCRRGGGISERRLRSRIDVKEAGLAIGYGIMKKLDRCVQFRRLCKNRSLSHSDGNKRH